MANHAIKVLLIEDEPAVVDMVERCLAGETRAEFDVDHADRLSSGLAQLSAGGIDAVLLDLGLPDSSGFDTFSKAAAAAPGAAIVVLSGAEDGDLAARASQEGAQDYLVKSRIHASELSRAVLYAVERKRILAALELANLELQKREASMRKLIEGSADGIVIVDRSGTVRFANLAAADLLGLAGDDLVGSAFGSPVVGGETAEIEIPQRGGGHRVAEMRMVEVEWEGEPACLTSLRDVTDRRRMITEMKKAEEQQPRVKAEFLSNVSHELRSPLAAVREFLTIVLDGLAGGITPEQDEYLMIALRNLDQVTNMVGDLLSATRADAGRLAVELRSVPLAAPIVEVIEDALPAARSRGLMLSADIAAGLPKSYADPARVRQILKNLIDNAMKFTPDGGTITVRARTSAQSPDLLEVAVTDTGCGIDKDELSRVFGFMYQARNATHSSRKGLGLGLYICRELVLLLGGRIWVESELGRGSTFLFTLPVFSLVGLVAPIVTAENLKTGSLVLVRVRFSHVEGLQPAPPDERALRCAREVLEHCVSPGRDVLLHPGEWGAPASSFAVLGWADPDGAQVMVGRIRSQLAQCEDLARSGLGPTVTYEMLSTVCEPPGGVMAEQPATEVARKIAGMVASKLC